MQFDSYECPGGYCLLVYREGGSYLHPFEVSRNSDKGFGYGLYGAEEVTKRYPLLGSTAVTRGSGTWAETGD